MDEGRPDLPRQPRAGRLNRRLRDLDRRLGIDNSRRGEWVWAIPVATFAATLLLFVGYMLIGGGGIELSLAVGIPMGLLSGAILGGLSIAYMQPNEPSDGGDDDRRPPPTPRPGPLPPPEWWARMSTEPRPPQGVDPAETGERIPLAER